MSAKLEDIAGIPVLIYTPNKLPGLPDKEDQLFEVTEGREEARNRKLKRGGKDEY